MTGEPLDPTMVGEARDRAVEALLGMQHADGWWKGELQANVTIDRSAGIAFAQAFDCDGKAAGGIQFEASEAADSFVVVNGLPNLDEARLQS